MRRALLLILFFITGATALGYQIVWTRMLANLFGHEMRAVIAVVTAFMAGMALGAIALGKPIQRSAHPGRWYAGLEVCVGLCALAIPVTGPWMLIPALIAMGASFPAMVRFVEGQGIAAFYAANTLGAVVGVLATVGAVLPSLGLRATSYLLGAVNIAVGLAALWLAAAGRQEREDFARVDRRSLMVVFTTGFLAIGFEILAVRVLAQVMENTIYSFSAALAAYLLGTSLGAALYHRYGKDGWLNGLLGWTAVVCLASVFVMSRAPAIYSQFRSPVMAEVLLAVSVFLAPTVCMGAIFSLLVQRAPTSFPRMLAVNTAGSALAPIAVGVVLLPAIGSKWSLIVLCLTYFSLVSHWRWITPALAAAIIAFLPTLHFVQVPSGGAVVEYREGAMASVAVITDGAGQRTLKVNNRFQMGGTSAAATEYRQAHFPLKLHPKPRRALFLGAGTGITFGAATLYPELEADGVELLPEVVAVMHHFKPENFLDAYGSRLRLHIADARRFVRKTSHGYDVIIADLFHPSRDGAGTLYTKQHFEAIRRRLNGSGIFCQWLPLHQVDEFMSRVIVRTFLDVFPDARAYLLHWSVDVPVLGLIATESWPDDADRVGDDPKLSGGFIAGADGLRRFAQAAPLNTDDHQVITYAAARFAYRAKSNPHEGLLTALAIEDPPTDYLKARNVYLNGLIHETEGRMGQAVASYIDSVRTSERFTMGYSRCISLAAAQAKDRPEAARALLQNLIEAKPNEKLAHELLERLFPMPQN